jgi:hypothetical protein
MATKRTSKASTVDPQPAETSGVADTKFTKAELLASPSLKFTERLFMRLALKDGQTYTMAEAQKAIKNYKKASI